MKVIKQFLVLLAVVCFTTFLVLGCGKENSNTPHASTTQTAQSAQSGETKNVVESKTYTDKEHVSTYVHVFKKLPSNYITKREAEALGWKDKGTLDQVAPGKSIGGDRYGNYEKQLPDKQGRTWKEADIDYVKGNRGPKRILYSNDGLVYYTGDHYKTFTRLY